MKALIKQLSIQLKMDVRDKGTLMVFYLVPLGFFIVVGAVFSSVNPEIKPILSATMAIFSTTMGAVIGIPPAIVRMKESGAIRAYQASGIPMISVVITTGLSALIHLSIVSIAISLTAPFLYGANMPESITGYAVTLLFLLLCNVSIGLLLGAVAKNTQTATLLSQAVFMPSLMLSGIMFPTSLLPTPLQMIGNLFPATYINHAFRGLAYRFDTEIAPHTSMAIIMSVTILTLALSIRYLGKITSVR
ncbi:MAG TPA: ABC transporter permease [Clostridiaceae bacterium]|jgi:ABC-2 type transport system permease protein|nr:ABC transporter permease [Clostridiaceae bacterium]